MLRKEPFPIPFRNASFPSWEIGLPFEKIIVSPRYTVIVISVAING